MWKCNGRQKTCLNYFSFKRGDHRSPTKLKTLGALYENVSRELLLCFRTSSICSTPRDVLKSRNYLSKRLWTGDILRNLHQSISGRDSRKMAARYRGAKFQEILFPELKDIHIPEFRDKLWQTAVWLCTYMSGVKFGSEIQNFASISNFSHTILTFASIGEAVGNCYNPLWKTDSSQVSGWDLLD